jgi:phosphoribosylanthranilate isomerase
MTWVKVCGLSTPQDVAAAEAAGADAVGFVLASSPRQVSVGLATELISGASSLTVLVTADLDPDEVERLLSQTGADALQPHGRMGIEAGRVAHRLGKTVIFPVSAGEPTSAIDDDFLLLLDTPSDSHHGGTGRTFDWRLADDVDRPIVLAGGLGPGNVAAAISATSPWGVDASSGLESAPGVKDAEKVRLYVERSKSE